VSTPGTEVQAAGWYDDPAGQARFRYWDGRQWTYQTSNAKDPASGAPALGPGFARLADWLARSLAVTAVAAGVVVAVLAFAAAEVGSYAVPLTSATHPDTPGFVEAGPVDGNQVGLALLLSFAAYTLIGLVTGILWLAWQYQLAESAPTELRRGPGMQVLSWFIPVVSYWWPYQNLSDLWQSYGVSRDRTRPDHVSGLGAWWAAYLGLPMGAGVLGGFLLASANSENVLDRLAVFYGAVFLAMLVSALLARSVVTRLSWRALEHCVAVSQA
jgi:hypothetical protein